MMPPGRWKAVEAEGGRVWHVTGPEGVAVCHGLTAVDAALVAAAPELLDACEKAADALQPSAGPLNDLERAYYCGLLMAAIRGAKELAT
jgi:hypothetical protein